MSKTGGRNPPMANGREDYQLRTPWIGPPHTFARTAGCRAMPALRVSCKNTYSSSDGGNAAMEGAACVSDRGSPVPLGATEIRPKATSDTKNSRPPIHRAFTIIPFILPVEGIAAGPYRPERHSESENSFAPQAALYGSAQNE